MNKHCFRLIFSKPLGFLIPVAEIATAQRKPGQQRTPCLPPTPPAFSLKRLVLSLLLAGVPGWAAAEILLDRNFGGTSVGSAANGVPVIEISNYPSPTLPETTHPGASITHPYKLKPSVDQQGIKSGQVAYQERKNKSHVIVNLAGDQAASTIADIKEKHPSSYILFQHTPTRLRYDSGIALDLHPNLPTKVYVLRDSAKPSRSTSSVLNLVAQMLERNSKALKVKELNIPAKPE